MSEKVQHYALTHPQKRIWFTEKLHPGTGMWNNAGTLKIKGKLDYALLERAVNIFLRDNESVRLRIGAQDGVPYQYFSDYEPCKIELIDFTKLGKRLLFEWDGEQTQTPIPLIDSSLYYFAMMKLSEHEGWLYFKFHHIISDGLALVDFCSRVMENYQNLLDGKEEPAEGADKKIHSYKEYINEEEEYLESQRFSDDQQYWLDKFEKLPEPTIIKQKTTNYFSTKAMRMSFIIPPEFTSDIKSFCDNAEISVFTLFMSALAVHINRITGKKDIVIGTPVANKTSKRAKGAFGMRVSTVPFRLEANDELPFKSFMQVVSDQWISALRHQKYPYDILIQELRRQHKELESLYDITLNFQIGTFEKNTEQFTYEARWHFSGHQTNSLSIHINDREDNGRFIVDYDHQIPYYSDKEIEYFHAHMMNLLKDIIRHPEKPLYMLEIMSAEESDRIMNRFNDTDYAFPKGETLVDLWNKQMKKAANNTAVICGEKSMSYKELDLRSSALAVHLKKQGVTRDSIVGLLVTRSFDYCIGALAILKAGGAFLPIDAVLPRERIAYMLSDSGAKALLITPSLENKCPELNIQVIRINKLPALSDISVLTECSPDSLAYVIYTSGSTGQPKGVQIEHHSAVHFVYSLKEMWNFTREARILCAASISFDMSVAELLLAFMNGASLVLAQENEVNIPGNMARLIDTAKVNMMIVTPGRMELLLSDRKGADCIKDFREIGMGGDVLSEKLLAKVQELTHARIFNLYGPTEITACATYVDVTKVKIPNIGRPMPDVKIYILDKYKNPVPIGVSGEIYIGGPGVARGYLNRPELTSKNFVDSPFCKGQRLYRTGDLARWYPFGEIEFLGRIDKQVKIRGYRVEIGEIEARLMQVPGVTACAVADRTDASDHKFLCAYLCGSPPKKSDIKAQLMRDMPSYMIPSHFMIVDSLPFNASGKLDRDKLPDPFFIQETSRDDYIPPETATEQILAGIWESVLNTEKIGRYDSFFDVGGDSLSIVTATAQVMQEYHVDISLEEVYRSPRLADIAALIDDAGQTYYDPILPSPAMDDYPVSSAQQRMWVLTQGQEGSVAYNIPLAFSIKGKPDIPRLKFAFKNLIDSHDALRTSFILKDGELRQRVQRNVEFELKHIKCKKTGFKAFLKGLIQPFDLSTAPLMRASVIEKGADDYVLFIDMHHIISDARTNEILLKDLADIYAGNAAGKKEIEYKDYSLWQQEFYKSENVLHQRDYWNETLSGELPLLNMHTDKPRPSVQQFKGARFEFTVRKQVLEKLRSFAKQKDSTTFMVILAVYNVLLSKYTGQEDIIIGTPVSGRNREEIKDTAGVFLNTVPLRNFPKGEMAFSDFFDALRKTTAAAFAHSDYPLERIITDLSLPRDISRNPLFDTMLGYSKATMELKLKVLDCRLYPFDPGTAKLDLTLEVYEQEDELLCMFEYNTQLFHSSTFKRMSAHLCRLFEILTGEPKTRLCDVSMMTPEELKQVIYDFNQTDLRVKERTIQSIFEGIAKSQAEKTALICDGKSMSFNELNNRANQIASSLREKGVTSNTIVAICIKRSFDMVAGFFGVLKAGGGYLPLDPSYPPERISFMLSDSEAKVLLTDGCLDFDVKGEKLYVQDIADGGPCENLPPAGGMEDAAYVIYTSGSTGIPKGVVLPRRGLLNLYESAKTTIEYDPDQTSVSVATVSFDIFIIEALLPLLFGCTVAVCTEEEMRQPHLLAALIESADVKFIPVTPTRMRILMGDESFRTAMKKHIEKIMLGGEECPLSLLQLIKKHTNARIINLYGPSEITVYCTFKDISNTSHITIGRPIVNTRIYILDRYMKPVPPGVLGEAYISGAGVGKGYINRDELNQKKYHPDPYWPGHMMYQSGDLCVFLPGGEIEICGRADCQVKIRGLRIELGEIEAAMRAIKGVKEAIIRVWGKDAERYLCAYYAMNEKVEPETIRKILSSKLPAYMVPSYFIGMDELPLTPSGKVNRKALLEPDRRTVQRKSAAGEEITENEKKMAEIWSRVLGVDSIGPDDSFFALGGDSLGVIKVQAAILQYGWTVPTRDFYELQNLRAVCARINKGIKKNLTPFAEKVKEIYVPQYSHLIRAKLRNVFLTGATGYLGAHILELLVQNPGTHVYCLVRGKEKQACERYLREVMIFYFGDEYTSIMKQVTVIKGDITEPMFGLNGSRLSSIDFDTVIHSAALTDHFGKPEVFDNINVQGTKNAIKLAKAAGAVLLHVSTCSVAGTYYTYNSELKGEFTENSYYVGQNFADNEYVKSKFLAEEAVLDAIAGGLSARIFRVGLLTGTLDGHFQMHPEKNAFANRIKALCSVGCVPLGMLGERVEMTPVDACAQGILKLAVMKSKRPVFHVFNDAISLGEVISLLEQNGYMFEVVSDSEFMRRVTMQSKRGESFDLAGLIEDLNTRGTSNITIKGDITKQELASQGFSWPAVDAEYMGRFLDSIKKSPERRKSPEKEI